MPHDDRNGVNGGGGGGRSVAELWETEGDRRLLQRYLGHSNSVTDIKEAGASLPCAKHPAGCLRCCAGADRSRAALPPIAPPADCMLASIVLSTRQLRPRQALA